MEDDSVGVQVPSLAPSPVRIVPFVLAVALIALAACNPPVDAAGRDCLAALERGRDAPDARFLAMLTPSSRDLVGRASRAGEWAQWRRILVTALGVARPVTGTPGVLRRGADGPTVFFVRDGHGWKLDLVLSGALFQGIRQDEYPPPG